MPQYDENNAEVGIRSSVRYYRDLWLTSDSILRWWSWRYSLVVSHLNTRYPNALKFHRWWEMRPVPPYVANAAIITDLFFLLFVISQKQMRWWAIIFREAHSTLSSRPRFQSNKMKK
jgi:hypothetical protein